VDIIIIIIIIDSHKNSDNKIIIYCLTRPFPSALWHFRNMFFYDDDYYYGYC